jgi:hypothetical protein
MLECGAADVAIGIDRREEATTWLRLRDRSDFRF